MLNWKSLLLFCHILICLKLLRTFFHRRFLNFLSPMVWKIWFLSNILLLFLISQMPISFFFFKILLLYIPLIFSFFLQSTLIFIWQQQCYVQFEFFLNVLIAQIKIGIGFRPAFKIAAYSLPQRYFQNYFIEILDTMTFSNTHRKLFLSPLLQQMIEELKRADSSSQCLEHLKNLRHHIHIRSIFRKKVQSTLLQIRIQSLVLLILYFGLFIFIFNKTGLKYIKTLLLSLFLFLTGLLVLSQLGKKIKWTI